MSCGPLRLVCVQYFVILQAKRISIRRRIVANPPVVQVNWFCLAIPFHLGVLLYELVMSENHSFILLSAKHKFLIIKEYTP